MSEPDHNISGIKRRAVICIWYSSIYERKFVRAKRV